MGTISMHEVDIVGKAAIKKKQNPTKAPFFQTGKRRLAGSQTSSHGYYPTPWGAPENRPRGRSTDF
jgi:hypothetical protein